MNSLDCSVDVIDLPLTNPIRNAFDHTECDREVVQFSGCIMPHGALLLVNPEQLTILGASDNCGVLFETDALKLLNQGLDSLFDASVVTTITYGLAGIRLGASPRLVGHFVCRHNRQLFTLLAHRTGQGYLLEFEKLPSGYDQQSVIQQFAEVQYAFHSLQDAHNWLGVVQAAVIELKRLTGFESVTAARFLNDGSFQVIAEARESGLASYLDKHFPKSDIPEPGRKQMRQMPVQHIPDNDYQPVSLRMTEGGLSACQVDLSLATLRSISPMCRRFYQNMGVRARLVLSWVYNEELKGFFNCMATVPLQVSYLQRMAYQAYTDMAVRVMIEKQLRQEHELALELKRHILAIGNDLTATHCLDDELVSLPIKLCALMQASGAILLMHNQTATAGVIPKDALLTVLLPWLSQQPNCFMTDRLAEDFAPAKPWVEVACGLMAIRLTDCHEYLLLFRKEWPHEVLWAGEPQKPLEMDVNAQAWRLTPRGSFDEWKQTVTGLARPWQTHEFEAINDLRMMLTIALNTQQLQQLNARNQESNRELESFAYTVSHDLQEPLRGILNFSEFLHKSLEGQLSEKQQTWLKTVMNLSTRMSHMVKTLLEYSRATEQPLSIRSVNLSSVLQDVVENLSSRCVEGSIDIDVSQLFPVVDCDSTRVAAIFENLIANGIKYNDKPLKQIKVGFLDTVPTVFFVRDNGIGIKQEHYASIFEIFRRLHGRADYGGGTGAGLTIARKHVERHGGQLWLKSILGQGSTFFFTLGKSSTDKCSMTANNLPGLAT